MPNTVLHCFNCTKMKPSSCSCRCKALFTPGTLFKCRPFSNVFKYLRRAGARRRRSSKRFRSVHAVFWPLMSMRSDERDRPADSNNNPSLTSMTDHTDQTIETHDQTFDQPAPLIISSSNINANDEVHEQAIITTKLEQPAPNFASSYIKLATQLNTGDQKNKTKDDNSEVQKACRSFEKYILEMLLEERKVRDLLDVEELLYCMDNLKSPAFVELVCTFYGELCLDLFSDDQGEQSVLEPGCSY